MDKNIHSGIKIWNIVFIRFNTVENSVFKRSLTVENSAHILKERLSEFDISLENNVPNFILKFGKLVNLEHRVCFKRGINLSVCDLLYKKKTDTAVNIPNNADSDDDDKEDNFQNLTNNRNIKDVIKKFVK